MPRPSARDAYITAATHLFKKPLSDVLPRFLFPYRTLAQGPIPPSNYPLALAKALWKLALVTEGDVNAAWVALTSTCMETIGDKSIPGATKHVRAVVRDLERLEKGVESFSTVDTDETVDDAEEGEESGSEDEEDEELETGPGEYGVSDLAQYPDLLELLHGKTVEELEKFIQVKLESMKKERLFVLGAKLELTRKRKEEKRKLEGKTSAERGRKNKLEELGSRDVI